MVYIKLKMKFGINMLVKYQLIDRAFTHSKAVLKMKLTPDSGQLKISFEFDLMIEKSRSVTCLVIHRRHPRLLKTLGLRPNA